MITRGDGETVPIVRATSKGISKSNAQPSVIIPFVMIPHSIVYF